MLTSSLAVGGRLILTFYWCVIYIQCFCMCKVLVYTYRDMYMYILYAFSSKSVGFCYMMTP